jgi:hypothetical protein
VAKSSRSRGRKTSKAARPASKAARPARKAKKTTRGKARAQAGAYGMPTPPTPSDENVIELRPIRVALQSHVSRLGTAIAARKEAQPELEEALKRLSRWLDDIQEICGPDMAIPV